MDEEDNFSHTNEENELFDIAQELRASLETPERELSEIVVPPFAIGVRFFDYNPFLRVREGLAHLRPAEGTTQYTQNGNWFYATEDHSIKELNEAASVRALLDPRTGYIIKDIEGIDFSIGTWTTGSGHEASWGGGQAIGRLHTLSKKDFSRFGHYGNKRVGEYFIRNNNEEEIILGNGDRIADVPKVGDHVIAIALRGDNFFNFQLLRPDPTANYELKGVYCMSDKEGFCEPFTIGAYHMGQDVSPIKIALKRRVD